MTEEEPSPSSEAPGKENRVSPTTDTFPIHREVPNLPSPDNLYHGSYTEADVLPSLPLGSSPARLHADGLDPFATYIKTLVDDFENPRLQQGPVVASSSHHTGPGSASTDPGTALLPDVDSSSRALSMNIEPDEFVSSPTPYSPSFTHQTTMALSHPPSPSLVSTDTVMQSPPPDAHIDELPAASRTSVAYPSTSFPFLPSRPIYQPDTPIEADDMEFDAKILDMVTYRPSYRGTPPNGLVIEVDEDATSDTEINMAVARSAVTLMRSRATYHRCRFQRYSTVCDPSHHCQVLVRNIPRMRKRRNITEKSRAPRPVV